MTNCTHCGRVLREGESAWASDWKVIDTHGTSADVRLETRYTCDDCEAKR